MMIHERSKVIGLNSFALQHRAINHPYLKALAAGCLPQPRQAIADFAVQYQGYTSWFPKYLSCVMSKLESEQHRAYFQ
jgi:pyrroloquinoline quinone (PQQ) biosynthesis protein C